MEDQKNEGLEVDLNPSSFLPLFSGPHESINHTSVIYLPS